MEDMFEGMEMPRIEVTDPEGNVFEDIVNGAKDKEQTVNGGEEQ